MITITHTLKGYSSTNPDDPGEATHYLLEFTDQQRKGWTTTADPDTHIALLTIALERRFRFDGHDQIGPEMKAAASETVALFDRYAERQRAY